MIRLVINVMWTDDYVNTKTSVIDALKLLKGWSGVEDAASAFCCLLISRGSSDPGRVPPVTLKHMLDEVSTHTWPFDHLQDLKCWISLS